MLEIGEKSVDTLYVCSKLVNQVYVGSKKVYPDEGVIPKQIKDAMVLWYDLKRQGATNESMAANPVLKDLSGNGHDATCYNFAWSGMSGVGGYIIDFDKFRQNTVSHIIVSYNKIIFRASGTISKSYTLWSSNTPSFKIRVTGLTNIGYSKLTYYRRRDDGTEEGILIHEDGEYELPESYNSVEGTGSSCGFNLYGEGSTEVVIEQLPLYPHALVSDGVDDYAMVEGLPLLTKERGYTVVYKRKTLKQGCFSSKSIDNQNNGAYVIELNTGTLTIRNDNFGYQNTMNIVDNEIVWQTSSSYNGTPISIGNSTDTDHLNIFTLDYGRYFSAIALYSFLLFNRDLTDEEIDWVKTNLMN